MKLGSKLIFILFFLLCGIIAFPQVDNSIPDDSFNLFLFSLLMIFVCVMIGAAIIGAMAAALLLFFLFTLITIGVLSSSVAIGLYKRSFSAGFKSFLMILLGFTCSVIGIVGLVIINILFALHLQTGTLLIIGPISGFMGGILIAIATYRIFQWFIKIAAQKLQVT
jgi:hypothetical protein